MKFSSVLSNMQLAYEMFVFWVVSNWREVLGAMVLILVGVGAGFGYQTYKQSCQISAHKPYIDVMRVVNADVDPKKDANDGRSFSSEQEKNEYILTAGEAFLANNSSTGLSVSVLGFMARALAALGRLDEARERVRQAEKACDSADIRQMYTLEGALMDIDSDKDDIKAQGVSSLKKLAQSESSAACDAALYRLGEMYWNDKNYQEARLWWGQLIAVADGKKTPGGHDIRSPWVAAARDKLALIDYK